MDSAKLEELEHLAKAATPGPWKDKSFKRYYDWGVICSGGKRIAQCTSADVTDERKRVTFVEKLANAAYIAAACNAVPELIKMYREANDEAADANSAWQKVRRENLALREQVRELEKALIELVKIEVPLPECAVCWERDRCTDRSHGDNCLAIGYIVDTAKEAAKEAGE